MHVKIIFYDIHISLKIFLRLIGRSIADYYQDPAYYAYLSKNPSTYSCISHKNPFPTKRLFICHCNHRSDLCSSIHHPEDPTSCHPNIVRSSFPFNSPWRSKFPRTARSLERAKCILISMLSGARLWNRSPRETIGKIERAPRRHPANISFLLAIQKGKGEEYWPLWLHSSFGISYSLYASSISLGRRCLSPREGRHLMHAHACTCAA